MSEEGEKYLPRSDFLSNYLVLVKSSHLQCSILVLGFSIDLIAESKDRITENTIKIISSTLWNHNADNYLGIAQFYNCIITISLKALGFN